MLNAERFKKEILDVMDKKDTGLFGVYNRNGNIFFDCKSEKCQNCIFDNAVRGDFKKSCGRAKIEWLLSEYNETVKLTRLEYNLLGFWKRKKYNYIARDSNGMVSVYHEKPSKKAEVWGSIYKHHVVEELNKSFLFVRWEDEKPTSIKEVLDNCEVVENESK